jgi:NAD(P)-dependent dehydrogenase (short-subunit alcohol dehydrogenase family)
MPMSSSNSGRVPAPRRAHSCPDVRSPESRDSRDPRTPMGRWGQPEELIGAIIYLASDAAGFVTGQTLFVDGGWLAW